MTGLLLTFFLLGEVRLPWDHAIGRWGSGKGTRPWSEEKVFC